MLPRMSAPAPNPPKRPLHLPQPSALALLVTALLMGTAGCAHKKPIDFGPLGLIENPETALEALKARRAKLKSVSGEAKLSAKTKQGSGSLGQFVLAQVPDQLRLESISFFGQPLAVLTVNGDFFHLHDLENGRFFAGEATAANVSQLLPVKIPPHELVSLLLGVPPLLENVEARSLRVDEKERVYVLDLSSEVQTEQKLSVKSSQQQRLGLDPATLRPLWVEMPARPGSSAYGATFSDYEEVDGFDVPKRIALVSLKDSQRLELRFSDREFNEEIEEEAFVQSPPPGAEILILQGER